MAIYNFTGANGDPLPSGLTAYDGAFEIQSNKLECTSASGSGTFALQSGTVDSFVELTINLAGLAANRTGISFRYTNGSTHWRYTVNGTGFVELTKVDSGATLVDSYTIAGFSASADYVLRVDFTGSSIVGKVDGTDRVSATDSFNSSATLHGLRAGNTTAVFDTMDVGTVASNITITEPVHVNRVYNCGSTSIAAVSFGITFLTSPAALQYRILDARDDVTEITTWATFDASPSGGVSTLSFNAPASSTPYHVQVRFSDTPATTALQNSAWSVGVHIFILGQSTSEDLTTDGAITAVLGHYFWSGTQGVVPTTGTGAAAMANAIIGSRDVAVMISTSSVGSTALTPEAGDADYWNNTGGTLWTNALAVADAVTDSDDRFEYICWYQGSKDGLAGVSTSVYQAGLVTFMSTLQAAFTNGDGGSLKLLTGIIGRDTRGTATDVNIQKIKTAQLDHAAGDANTYILDAYTFESADGIHLTDSGLAKFGAQYAAVYAYSISETAVKSPVISSATNGDTTSEVDITYDENLLTSDTTYSTEGVRVELDGSPLTVSSFARKSATVVTITLSAPIGTGTVTAYIGYGVGSTQLELTYPRSANVVLPNTGGTFNILATAVNNVTVSNISSTLNITVTSTPDGTYKTIITNPSDDSIVFAGNLAYSSGAATTGSLSLAVSTALTGFVIDNEATHVNGAVITGTTV
jgi:hypothetical protein